MNFLVTLGAVSSQEQYVINAPSWSSCLAYCEGTQQPIFSIQLLPNSIINYNVSGTNCFIVSGKNAQGVQENHYVWESNFESLSAWVELQGFQTVNTVQSSNKTYVVV